MRVLLDECVPRGFRNEFDCLLTVDANLQYQQHSGSLPVAVLVVKVRTNRLAELRAMGPQVRDALFRLRSREFHVVGD